jgi:hypothetical protein
MPKRFTLTLTIECQDAQTEYQAHDRLHRWLETEGHTTSAFGFTPLFVGLLPRPASSRKITPSPAK